MTNLIQNFEKTSHEIVNPINNLLKYLFADKKTLYIEDISINTDGSFDVAYCRGYALNMTDPEWIDITISRATLLNFIRAEKLNYWEAFRYDHRTGSVQPFTNVANDIDIFLDEQYRDVIKEYLEGES